MTFIYANLSLPTPVCRVKVSYHFNNNFQCIYKDGQRRYGSFGFCLSNSLIMFKRSWTLLTKKTVKYKYFIFKKTVGLIFTKNVHGGFEEIHRGVVK